jgi:DNA-directed RNA polymerase beta subunit
VGGLAFLHPSVTNYRPPDISLATGTEIYSPGTFVVHVNGSIIGITRYATRFVYNFRKLRRAGKVNEFVGVYINHHQKTIHVASDGGRICRPMIIVEKGKPRVTTEHIEAGISRCVERHLLKFRLADAEAGRSNLRLVPARRFS